MDAGIDAISRFRKRAGEGCAECGVDSGGYSGDVVLEYLDGAERYGGISAWLEGHGANIPVARQRKFDASTMRTYILLSQILPISFTVTLFIIQLHLSSPDIQPPTPAKDPTQSQSPPARRKPLALLQLPNILLNASLLAQPSLRGHSIFSSLLFFERSILLLPHSGLISLRDSEIVKCITVSGGFAVANAAMMRKDLTFGGVTGALGNGSYAVKALGWDAMLGLITYVVLRWGGGV
jgi:hypothetical protein